MRPLRPLLLLAAVLVSVGPASAQWEYAGPGFFTPVGVAQHENQVFFAVSRGSGASVSGGIVYRSPDGIDGWEPVPDPLIKTNRPAGPYITSIGAGAGVVVIATREAYNVAYLYLSTDDGASWTERRTFPTVYEGGIRALFVPNANTLVALANTGGGHAYLFSSTDAGLTWTQQPRDFGSVSTPTILEVDGRLVISGGPTGIEVSDDLGATWTLRTHSGTTFPTASFLWADGSRIFHFVPGVTGASNPPGLHWTDDFGASFTSIESQPSGVAGTISSMDSRGDRIVARGFLRQRPGSSTVIDDEVVGVSEDLGGSWIPGDRDSTVLRSIDGSLYADPIGVVGVPGGFVYSFVLSNTNASVLYTSRDGLDWTPAPVNGFGQTLGSVFEHDGDLYAFEIGHGAAGGYWRSDDGAAWRYVTHLNNDGPSPHTCGESSSPGLAASMDSVIVAVCTDQKQVYRSRDGLTFTSVGPTPATYLRTLTTDGGRLFAIDYPSSLGATGGQRGTLYRSDDAGATWTALASGLRSTIRLSVSGDRMVLAEAGNLYLSTDGGATFAQALPIPGTIPSAEVGAAATPTALFAGAAQTNSFFNTPQFFRSLDGGATWQDLVADGLIADGPRSLHALADGSVAAVFTDSVAVSSDNGTTWRSLVEGWPAGSRGEDAFVHSDTLYVLTLNGSLWRAALADFVGSDGPTASETRPDAGVELTAWPNPAATAATVRVRLDAPGRATLTVSDVLGRTVATLVDGDLRAGEQTLPLDTSALAPGVYVLRLTLDDGRSVARSISVAR